ncbi:hypothetical protein TTHERM_00149590 (macronuclear) [Tetrahymena thermophila SB210]|uniref:Leucine rich repeat protein n=1 Tax=Tetrahymena thermophila (strain SB210) TaxID=312017 RepID=I7M2V0_TETTS|nr:hypothetical protein TTHERM_00149590 [Tetrahymena thermophila SB210]EAS01349.2 hypothetical protein TTHERM_00149590 [Tetrahymena thermophila SB210]|eukprot:XP_001021594.2 hypothetical protein TTHERM_00149590 [Tetrahymena thermophila SB210]
MNKQKQKAIVPIYSDYEDKIWWQYVEYSEQQNQQFEDFFKKNAKDLPNYITNDFFQTLNNIHKLIGLKPHPVLAEEPLYFQENHGIKNNGQISQEELGQVQIQNNNAPSTNDIQESKYVFLLFQNIRVDQFSLKIIQLILPNFNNLCALKFCNNNFSQQSINLLLQLINQPNCPITKLFFEWNPLRQDLMQSFIPALGLTQLEFLVLRSCQITDEILISLVDNFKSNPNLKLKYLELYHNNLKGEGIKALGQFIEKYQKFEYIGLSKNGIQNLENLKEMFQAIGKKVMSQEELAFYREKEKEKEAIIQKATKNKKRITEDMYPHLDPIIQMPDGQFATVRNTQMKMLNLSLNSISEAESEQLEKFLSNITEDLQIVLYHNNFEGKYKEKLKKKYRKNIQI